MTALATPHMGAGPLKADYLVAAQHLLVLIRLVQHQFIAWLLQLGTHQQAASCTGSDLEPRCESFWRLQDQRRFTSMAAWRTRKLP